MSNIDRRAGESLAGGLQPDAGPGRQQLVACATSLTTAGLVVLLLLTACSRQASIESVPVTPLLDDDWTEQYAAVQAGQSDTIAVEGRPVAIGELAQLEQLGERLSQLLFDAGGIDDAALAYIARVKSLTHLRIRLSQVSDDGIEMLVDSGMPELRILNIPQGSISARGIARLAELPKLNQLRLGGRQLDDIAAAHIAKLPELHSLHLIGPSLSDAALDWLAKAPKLDSFYLDDCPLSDEAWERLFAAKPDLHVHVDQQHHDRDPNQHE